MDSIIKTNGLTKTFMSGTKEVKAVDGINLAVKKEIFGLLGPNGAGKTTTMRMLTTLLKPTSGTALIAGHDLTTQADMVRRSIGYVSQTGGLERSASARENLVLQARLYGLSQVAAEQRTQELIIALALEPFADRAVETYSGGQRRRVDLAMGMVHKPKILFLDEPTVGLDPASRAHVWQEVKQLHEAGTTIFLTTHYLDEADMLCDRIAIVDHGNLVALDTPQALKRAIASDVILLGMPAAKLETVVPEELFKGLEDIREVKKEADGVRFLVHHGEALLPKLLKICDNAGIAITTISLHKPTLDDVFLQKTGRSFIKTNQEGA